MGRALKELTDHRNDRVYTLARTYTHARTHAVFCSRFFARNYQGISQTHIFFFEDIRKKSRWMIFG